jgi:hypothetical protein
MVIQQERQHTFAPSPVDEPNSFVNVAGGSGRSKSTYSGSSSGSGRGTNNKEGAKRSCL